MAELEFTLYGLAIAFLYFLSFVGVVALLSYLPPSVRRRTETQRYYEAKKRLDSETTEAIRKHNLRRVK